jgi:hypothetical protein
VPIEYLSWAVGRIDASPEEILRRTFIEAAMMYQNASLGSMIRVEASKGGLTATFGVEIKRTAYFFKDRDVTVNTLTASGRRKPIFHIVRPHLRHTKKGEIVVPMHFSGLKDFDWAGYKVGITVPGRDHMHLTNFDVGQQEIFPKGEKTLTKAQLGDRVRGWMKDGVGAWK